MAAGAALGVGAVVAGWDKARNTIGSVVAGTTALIGANAINTVHMAKSGWNTIKAGVKLITKVIGSVVGVPSENAPTQIEARPPPPAVVPAGPAGGKPPIEVGPDGTPTMNIPPNAG